MQSKGRLLRPPVVAAVVAASPQPTLLPTPAPVHKLFFNFSSFPSLSITTLTVLLIHVSSNLSRLLAFVHRLLQKLLTDSTKDGGGAG